MGEFKIGTATSSDLTNAVDDVTVDQVQTDGPSGGKETTWHNDKWPQQFGYYKAVPELKQAIDMRAIWTVGKGFTADERTTTILDHFIGWGNDTFNDILKNMIRVRRIGGDAYAEIIKDAVTGDIVNLKPLDPGSMRLVVNSQGIIIRYEQIAKGRKTKKFEPSDIFHLTNKRVGDEIHGVSDIDAIEPIVKAANESFADVKQLMHRHVKPIMAFKLDTDDPTEIDAFITKMDEVINKGENIYIPKGTVEFEIVSVPSNATLNPLPWREHLRNYFFQVVGIPQIILGSSGEFTESTAKIAYLAFQQSVEDEQKDIEDQIWNQLFLKIDLTFPASMQNELLSDEAKDGDSAPGELGETAFQPNDTIAGVGE